MKNIKFFNKVKISITSIKGYRELLKDSLSKAILYSIILSLIVGSFLGVFSFITAGKIQKSMKDLISSEKFKFTLEDGILNFENSPIKKEYGGELIIYVDTNITLDEVDSIRKLVVHKNESLVILRDGISYRIDGNKFDYKFSELPLITNINNETILKSLNLIEIVKYLVFFINIILTYFSFIINSLALSVCGIIISKMNKLKMYYKDILKLSIYATTLPAILGIIVPIGTFSLLISGIYLILVMKMLKFN
ncbi:DUF1189 family protein [Clostridium sp. Sa3CUN1]|uniref:DUF1189 family protein n=1 Tax=Clostridium gallinarum TaxID=2762246 RepID=A0ABR8Q7E6_9CLOT|nr:DUF1189 family protein [Clostridium gallinarum]MBD7916358.1 DUF1189 family protein [Clostridium gallinarum]